MVDLSISKCNRNTLFQLFCGRSVYANIIDHPGTVFNRLLDYDWLNLKKNLGITHIYLLGIWNTEGPIIVNEERGQDLRFHDKRCPSPFAISNHKALSPLLGSLADFSALVDLLHECQLKVVVDFVPNHTGVNHYWVTKHPEYYKKNQHNVPQPAFSGDVLELDYRVSEVQTEMMSVIHFIAESLAVDGIRCDMAHLIPDSFWHAIIDDIHTQLPQFEFIAEAYSSSVFDLSPQVTLMKSGFDAIYDEPLYRNIKQFGNSSISEIMGHVQYVLTHNSKKWLHYLSNHDDVYPLNPKSMWAFQQLCLLLPGWNLLYNGSLWGFSGRLAHHWVEILPSQYSDFSLLSKEKLLWFEWYNDNHPMIKSVEIVSQTNVLIYWVGDHEDGILPLYF